MRRKIRAALAFLTVVALAAGCGGKPKSEHGGVLVEAGDYRCEIVFSNLGAELYLSGKSGPVEMAGVAGSASVEAEGEHPRWADIQVKDDHLFMPYDFPVTEKYQANVTFTIKGAGGENGKPIQFSAPYEPVVLHGWTCPRHPDVTTLRRGRCVKCGGAEKVPAEVHFVCPRHPDVVSLRYGECEQCGGANLVIRPVGPVGER